MPETTNISPAVKTVAAVDNQPATAPVDAQPKRRAFRQRRSVWLIAALRLIGSGVFGYLPARKAARLDPVEALARD
jgi:ABC-type lipoprotein release transport system permease subunit